MNLRSKKDVENCLLRVSSHKMLRNESDCDESDETPRNCVEDENLTASERSSPKKAKISAPRQVGGYSSDGMSFESLPDDELPDIDINLSSPSKGNKFVKGDIVWAPYKKIYWPALVTSERVKEVCFVYVNEPKKYIFRTLAKKLVPFDNPVKNRELKQLGEKHDTNFIHAYELLVKYLCRKKEISGLDARRFLTLSDKDDTVLQAKDCLFRLTGVSENIALSTSVDNEEEDGMQIFDIDEYIGDAEDDGNEEVGNQISAEEKTQREEILKDLENLPSKMTVTFEESEKMKLEAQLLISFIQSKDCSDHLMKIRNGSLPSSRHNKFVNAEVVLGGLGPFTLFPDLTNQLLTALDDHCGDLNEPSYKHNVMLPEAIIYAIRKMNNYSKVDAKKHYNVTCKKLAVRD